MRTTLCARARAVVRMAGALRPGGLAAALGLLLSVPLTSVAQETGTITGRVTNAVTNAPVGSAQVFIEGTALGGLSRADGRFLIPGVPAGTHRIQARLIGYGSAAPVAVTVRAGVATSVDLQLRESAISLDEVVVTGVGAASRRREIGTSLTQIQVGELNTKPIENIESLLRGSTPGVQSLSVTGQVGAGGTLQLRGVTSVSQGNEPLIYVDGVRLASNRIPPANLEDGRGPRVSGMSLNELNVGDIERIEVIKGAAATTLYGTEASGGVVQIFTKRGTSGRAQWSFSTSQGQNFWPRLSSTIRAHDTWLDLKNIQHTGWSQRYEGSVRGGTETMQYYIAANRGDEEGIVRTQGSENWGATGNFGFEPIPAVMVRWNSSYSSRSTRFVGDSNNRHGYLLNVMRLEQGYVNGQRETGAGEKDWLLTQELLGGTDNFVSGVSVEHAHPRGIRNTVRFGMHHVEAANSGLLPFGYPIYDRGNIGVQRWRNRTLTAEYTGSWEAAITPTLRSTLAVGGQLYDETNHGVNAGGTDFAGPGRVTVSSAARTYSSEDFVREVNTGVFVEEKLGWRDLLFATVGARLDGSSTFGQDYGLQFYPKLSLSYVLSEEGFWPFQWWNSLRLRAAVGEAGKAPGAFDAVRTWEAVAGLKGQPGVTPNNLGDANLGPERTREVEVGFDASLFDDRFTIDFSYYDARTRQALFQVVPIPSQGFTRSQLSNVGELLARGVEVSAQAVLLETRPLAWSLGANLTTAKSEVLSMGGAAPVSVGYQQWIREGYPAPAFFGRRVTNPDELADPRFENDVYLGATFPNTTLGLSTNLTLGGLVSMAALGELSRGGHVLNSTGFLNTIRDIWPDCTSIQQRRTSQGIGTLSAAERAKCIRPFNGEDQFIESGDFLKLREISATLRLPQRVLPASVGSATLSVLGTNLLTITDFTGLDPEVIDGGSSGTQNFRRVDYYNLPPRRSVVTKLSVTF
jgi:TonB-dependent starch-binding outer membrane protein SusC